VVRELEGRGAVFVQEADEVPRGAVMVLAAHGVSPVVRRQAAERELTVIDGTCPLVSKVHAEVRRFVQRGEQVFLVGHGDHEEVEGTLGEAPDDVIVVENVEQARRVAPRDPQKVAYVTQTTLSRRDAESVIGELGDRFPALGAPRSEDICFATTNRQQAVQAIAEQVDLILVVGSANSSNSRRLVEVAEQSGTPALLIDAATELDLSELRGTRRLGITAGASAPPQLVAQLIDNLAGLGPLAVREHRVTDETVTFSLPPGVS
jgi:4-hydroxy-3-methylbut-2-enyl diphosphate reductase